jgi:hypothetical protein
VTPDLRQHVWLLISDHMITPNARVDAIIARVRADERARWSPPAPTTRGHVAYCWCPTCLTGHDVNVEVIPL